MLPRLIAEYASKLKHNTPRALLARGVGADMTIRLSGAGVGMLLHLLLARAMGVSDYGVFVYAFNWFVFLEAFCVLGFGRTIVRFAPVYRAHGQWPKLHGLLRTGTHVALSAGVVLAISLICMVFFLGNQMPSSLRVAFYVSGIMLPIAAMTQPAQDTLRAFNRIALALFPRTLLHPILVVFLVLVLNITGTGSVNPPTVMLLFAASMSITLIIQLRMRTRVLQPYPLTKDMEYDFRNWAAVALPMLLTTAFNIANRRIGILMTGALLETTDAGLYAVDNRLSQILVLGVSAVDIVLAPIAAQLFAQERHKALQRTVTLATRGIVLLTVPAGIILIVAGRFILSLFGAEFVAGYAALVILVATFCLCAAMGPVGQLLLMTGHHKNATIIMAITTLLNITLNFLFIPMMGIEGAALAACISLAGSRIVLALAVKRKLNLNSTIFCL